MASAQAFPPGGMLKMSVGFEGHSSPHYSWALLPQSRIRSCDQPVVGRARRSVGRHPVQGCLASSRLHAPVSLRNSALSRRTVM